MKFQPRPGFEALEVRGGRIFRSEPNQSPCTPRRVLEAPGGPWSPLEAPAGPWSRSGLELRGNPNYDGFGVLGTFDWDLRWIMTRALLRDTRSFSYRFVARSQNTCRLLVKCLWTPEGFQAQNAMCLWTPEGFQAPNAIH